MDEDKIAMFFTDGRGNEVHREVNQTLDIRNFEGMAGYAWLVVAANRHLSQDDIVRYLEAKADGTPGVARTRSWIQRRVWMFHPRGWSQRGSPLANRDGKDARAVELMAANPKLSLVELSWMLKRHGIKRSREWCRCRRTDGMGAV